MTFLRELGVEVSQCQELRLKRKTEATKGSDALISLEELGHEMAKS